jgi:aspartate carbamoyltransferase catalytic subunit
MPRKYKKNLISIDDLSIKDINKIHSLADKYFKKPPKKRFSSSNKILINFFFENSTRTRTSFEIAAKRLGMKVVNINFLLSSLKKGETLIDTAKTINAMNPDYVVIRHNSSGIMDIFKKYINCDIINAGDGTNEHPTQALLDLFTIRKNKKTLENLQVTICGDILHSRVAHSNIKLFHKFGCKIKVVTPPTLMPKNYQDFLKKNWDIELFNNIEDGIKNSDVIMMLRIQQERMSGCYIPSLSEYFKIFGLTHEKLKLAANNPIILHPGPINREVEISSKLADDENISLILDQVEAGVANRQAILEFLS